MKDLYTFDLTRTQALETYEEVRGSYNNFFDALKVPYLVAEADSGAMGGSLSHEYHLPTAKGEDNIISCTNCHYVANEEVARNTERLPQIQSVETEPTREGTYEHGNWRSISCEPAQMTDPGSVLAPEWADVETWCGVSRDRRDLIVAYHQTDASPESGSFINSHAVKMVVNQLDSGVEGGFIFVLP